LWCSRSRCFWCFMASVGVHVLRWLLHITLPYDSSACPATHVRISGWKSNPTSTCSGRSSSTQSGPAASTLEV
jgi:hypothetical protein